MHKIRIFLVLLSAACLFPINASAERKTIEDKNGTSISNTSTKWIIVMRDPRSQRRRQRATGIGYSTNGSYAADPKLARASSQLTKDYDLNIVTQWPIKSLNVHCLVVTLPEGSTSSLLNKLGKDPRVESVQMMNEFEVLGHPDPYQKMQPALDQLATIETHKYFTGMGVSIAIIDSAIDTNHPDLENAVVWQENLVDDEKILAESHGTGIAGIIAARSNNGIGITGIAPDATVYGLRACWQNNTDSSKAHCNTLTLSRALDRVIDEKPTILNLSLSGPHDPLLQRLIKLILAQKTIIVSAFDEGRSVKDRFPKAQNGVFYGRSGKHYVANDEINCLPAPSIDILTLQPSRTYDVLNGDSLAAAHISGAIAILLEANPKLEVNEITSLLKKSIVIHTSSASINTCKALQFVNPAIRC